ncbi:MAG: hypothetical protein Kow0059_09620 [Candidatus Sumerlaeia bacterium]
MRRFTIHTGGFTLIEIVLAVTIFAVVVTALFATFHVGTTSYERSQEVLDVVQRARFVFENVGRDLRCVVYANESDYNQNMKGILNAIEQERLKAEENDTLDEFYEKYWGENEDGTRKSPYDFGIMYDLSFKGTDENEADSLEFTTYQSQIGYMPKMPWGVARVKYRLEDGALLREITDVMEPGKDLFGEVLPDDAPFIEEIAHGVREFDLRYGYFYAGEWLEATDWDSKEKRYRTPPIEFSEEDPELDPNFQAKMQLLNKLPEDNLPAYVAVTIALEDPTNAKKLYRFQSEFRLPTSQETFVPVKFGDEEVDYFAEDTDQPQTGAAGP